MTSKLLQAIGFHWVSEGFLFSAHRQAKGSTFDIIGQSRSHVMQLELPPGMWLHLLDIDPGYRFDGEDRLFYLTDHKHTEYDSCMIRLRGGESSPNGDHIKVNFECVFFALGWSSTDPDRPPQCTSVDYAQVAAVFSELRIDACAWDFRRNFLLDRLVFHGISRMEAVAIQGRDSRVRVSFRLQLVSDGNICNGNFWRVRLPLWNWMVMRVMKCCMLYLGRPSQNMALRTSMGSSVDKSEQVLVQRELEWGPKPGPRYTFSRHQRHTGATAEVWPSTHTKNREGLYPFPPMPIRCTMLTTT